MTNFLKIFRLAFAETPRGFFAPLVAIFNVAKANATHYQQQHHTETPTRIS